MLSTKKAPPMGVTTSDAKKSTILNGFAAFSRSVERGK
jgi:hypothetical protein